jgi:hypothetical protein
MNHSTLLTYISFAQMFEKLGYSHNPEGPQMHNVKPGRRVGHRIMENQIWAQVLTRFAPVGLKWGIHTLSVKLPL